MPRCRSRWRGFRRTARQHGPQHGAAGRVLGGQGHIDQIGQSGQIEGLEHRGHRDQRDGEGGSLGQPVDQRESCGDRGPGPPRTRRTRRESARSTPVGGRRDPRGGGPPACAGRLRPLHRRVVPVRRQGGRFGDALPAAARVPVRMAMLAARRRRCRCANGRPVRSAGLAGSRVRLLRGDFPRLGRFPGGSPESERRSEPTRPRSLRRTTASWCPRPPRFSSLLIEGGEDVGVAAARARIALPAARRPGCPPLSAAWVKAAADQLIASGSRSDHRRCRPADLDAEPQDAWEDQRAHPPSMPGDAAVPPAGWDR